MTRDQTYRGRRQGLPLRVRLLDVVTRFTGTVTVVGRRDSDLPTFRAQLEPSGSRFGTVIRGRIPRDVVVDTVDLTTSERRISARRFRPVAHDPRPRPIVVDFHGGGFVIGSPALKDWFNGHLASLLGAIVISPEYRLAPEHRYPNAHEDAVQAFRAVGASAAQWGGDPGRMIVAGDSAGAVLAAHVAHTAVDDVSVPRPVAQVLLYPPTDFSRSYPSLVEHAHDARLSDADAAVYLDLYFGDRDRRDPGVSLLFRELRSELPPTVVLTAECDPLRDQGVAYAYALHQAGVPVRHTTYQAAAHGFLSCPGLYPVAFQALSDTVGALEMILAPTESADQSRISAPELEGVQ